MQLLEIKQKIAVLHHGDVGRCERKKLMSIVNRRRTITELQ